MRKSKNVSKAKKREDDPLAGDLSGLLERDRWQLVRFEHRPKNKTITLRLSEDLLDAVKAEADKQGVDYQKLIRLTLERLVS